MVASAEEARLLSVEPGSALMLVTRTAHPGGAAGGVRLGPLPRRPGANRPADGYRERCTGHPLILMPMGLFGPRSGTNNAVSSGAHFGVRGRVVGSFLSLLTAIAFYSISVWVSGDALVGAAARLFGVPDSELIRAAVYAVLGALVIVVVIYGYQFMLLVNKVVVVGNTVLILLGIVAYASVFDFGYDPGPQAYALGSFWPTFVLSAVIVMGNPISFGAFLGDWSRYIPAETTPARLLAATFFGHRNGVKPTARHQSV
ncbi:MAG: cytosine permease [Nocardioidaceae bacterium]